MTQTVTLKDVFNEIQKMKKSMITKKEFTELKESMEILSNPHTMKQIKDSEKDIAKGRVKEVHSVQDLI